MKSKLELDRVRYGRGEVPRFQIYFRKTQEANNKIAKLFYKVFFVHYRNKNHIEMSADLDIGEGFYVGHPYCITINVSNLSIFEHFCHPIFDHRSIKKAAEAAVFNI